MTSQKLHVQVDPPSVNKPTNDAAGSQISRHSSTSQTLLSGSPTADVEAQASTAVSEEKPYSIYSRKEKWLIVWLASLAGLFR